MNAPETAHHLLDRFLEPHYKNGLELWLDQGQLRFKGPKEILKKDLIKALKKHKSDIILMLQESEAETRTEMKSTTDGSMDVTKPAVDRCDVVDAEYPLSMSQSAIWMLYQFAPNSPVYNTTFCARLHESVDIGLLEKAYQNTVNRHDMLRSRFLDGDGGSLQQVMHSSHVSIDVVDGISWEQGKIDEWLENEAVAPFDLSNSNALRIKCLKTKSGDLLIATIHHIAADLWSLLIIAEDLFSDYQHYLSHGYFNLVKAKHRYQDHVIQQKLYLQSDDIEEVRVYWQEYLANASFQLDMPTDYVRPAIMMMSTARRSTIIGSQVAESVREFCKKNAITPYVLFESAFQLLLFRYAQRSNFLIGTPTFGRSTQALEKIVGDFANPVVLRVNIARRFRVIEWLKGNQKDLFKVMALQDFPFPSLVELINPPRDASRTPLFQHMFVWHQGNQDTFLQQNLIEEILPISGPCGSPYDILLSVSDMGSSFECHWTYQTSLYEDVSIKQFSGEFEQLIYSLLESSNDATIDAVLNEIEIPSLDICGELTSNVFFKGRKLSDYVVDEKGGGGDSAATETEGPAYSLVCREEGSQPVTCLHEYGRLVRHCLDTSTVLPLMGHYNAKGDIVVTEVSNDWGIVDKRLVNLREIALDKYEGLSERCIIFRCSISAEGNVRNVLYLESGDDETVDNGIGEDIRTSMGFLQDVIFLSRFVRDEYGDVDRFWLLGIPLMGMPMSINRTQQPLLSRQTYPIREEKVNGRKAPNRMEELLVEEGEPAVLLGGTLSSSILTKDIIEALIKTAESEVDAGFVFVDEAGDIAHLSYKELLHSSIAVANGLRNKGIREKQVVILQVSDRSEYFTLWWALLWLGAMPLTIAVPSEYSDDQPIARKLKSVVNSLSECVVISDFSNKYSLIESYIDCDVICVSDISNTVDTSFVMASVQERNYCKLNDVAFLQLTSGSTGTPKVIQITHQGILHQVYAAAEYNQFEVGDKTLNWLPYDHVVPILTTHLRDVILGLSQYQVSTASVLSDPLNWLRMMEKYEIQHSWSPNFGFKLVVDALNAINAVGGEHKISSLQHIKTLMNAGEQVIPSVVSDFMKLLKPLHLNGGAMQSAFGMAESCTCITYDNDYGVRRGGNGGFSSLGGAIPGIEIRIVNEENVLSHVGTVGRMQIRGPVVTPGYLNNPSANDEAFVGDGWFNSGDLGYISKGTLVLTGREKEMIVIRGVNYYCYEIEESITRHPSVIPTFVAAFSVMGDSGYEELVVVYVENENIGASRPEREINTIINREFGIEARYIIRVKQNEFYKTTSGKIQRSQFRKHFSVGKYKKECLDFDRLLGATSASELSIPYHIYESDLERLNISSVDDCGDASNFTSFSFDITLVEHINDCCANRVVTKVNSVADIALLTNSIPTTSSTGSSNILLLLQIPVITDVEAMQTLVISVTDVVVQLGQLFDQLKRKHIDNEVVLHTVLIKSSQNSASCMLSMKPLMDALTQELYHNATGNEVSDKTGGKAFSLRLRMINDSDVSDSLLEKIVTLKSVRSPLYLDAGVLLRPALKPSFISIDQHLSDAKKSSPICNKVFVVTGGFGGLGLELVNYLLDNECKVIVIGRRDIRQCEKMQALAKNIRMDYGDRSFSYHSVALLDNTHVEHSVFSGLQYLDEKSIDGIFHLAGCYLQKPAASMANDDWTQCFDTKYAGSLVLGKYLQHAWPDAILVNFSSVNSYFGAPGLSGYSIANALQNQCSEYFNNAESRCKDGGGAIRTFCLNWSVWPGTGMAQGFSSQDIALAKNKGFFPMSATKDLLLLGSILNSKPGNYWLGLDHEKPAVAQEIDWKFVPRQWHVSAPDVEPKELDEQQYIELPTIPQPIIDVPDPASITNGQLPRNKTDEILFDIWVSLLGSRVSHIDQTFFECGGNSVVVTQLMYKVTVNFNESLPLSSIFEYSTIRKFSDFLSRKNEPEGEVAEESAFSSAIYSLNLVDQIKNLQIKNSQIRESNKDQVTLISGNIEGPKNTIIYIPALIGLPHSYQHLLHAFPECNQVLLSQDVLTQSEGSIRELASEYIGLLRNFGVDLACCTFVGWSFGGCVAFEIMRQLEVSSTLNHQRKLIVVDSGVREAIPLFLSDDAVAFPLFCKDLGLNLATMEVGMNTGEKDSIASRMEPLQVFLTEKNAETETAVLDAWFNTYKNNMQLLREYKPGLHRIDADAVYIKANGNALTTPDMGWGEQFLNFNVMERDSDHQQVVYDSVLVELIKAC